MTVPGDARVYRDVLAEEAAAAEQKVYADDETDEAVELEDADDE